MEKLQWKNKKKGERDKEEANQSSERKSGTSAAEALKRKLREEDGPGPGLLSCLGLEKRERVCGDDDREEQNDIVFFFQTNLLRFEKNT